MHVSFRVNFYKIFADFNQNSYSKKGEVSPLNTLKSYWFHRGIAPLIPNLGTTRSR